MLTETSVDNSSMKIDNYYANSFKKKTEIYATEI